MKKRIILILIATFTLISTGFSQIKLDPTPEEISTAKSIKENIGRDTDKIAILKTTSHYSFFFNRLQRIVSVEEETDKSFICIDNKTSIHLVDFYSDQSIIKNFVVSNKKGKNEYINISDSYLPSDEYFYHDIRLKSTQIDFPLAGYIYNWKIEKETQDIKYFTSIFFTEQYPIKEKKIVIKIPNWLNIELKELNFGEYNIKKTEVENKDKSRTITYVIKDLKSIKTEDSKPGRSYDEPHLLILPKSFTKMGERRVILNETQDLYNWYKSLIDKLDEKPEKLEEFVHQLIDGLKTDDEKIKAIYYWVQDHIRYIAYEDGIAGFKPDESQNVYEKKYGDCKGMANLLKQMLVIAGYEAHLTWIGTDRISYDYSTPNLSVDNHMICTLSLNGKRYFLDGTQRYNSFGTYANRIQGRPVLIENGDDFILDKVPVGSFKNNLEVFNISYKIENENLKGSVTKKMNGESKTQFMYGYNKLRTDKKEEVLNDYLTRNDKNLKVENIQTSDLLNRDIPTDISYDITITNQIAKYDDEYYIDLDYFKEFSGLDLEKREHDYLFGYKTNYSSKIELEIPMGLTVSDFPENIEYKSENIEVSLTYTTEGNTFIYTKIFIFKDNRISNLEFEKWNSFYKKMKTNYNSQITLTK